MKHASLSAAAALVLLANAAALIQVARNRTGPAEAEITLTDRELIYRRSQEDSGVALRLRWTDPGARLHAPEDVDARAWLDLPRLRELGFDCSVAPSDRRAYSFYRRQSARTGFVALEYDGAAWQSWLETRKPDYDRHSASRLVPIDAARDAAALRGRHPDRNGVLILPAIIRITVAGGAPQKRPARLTGHVLEIPSLIHVPLPFSDGFRRLSQAQRDEKRETPLYRVRLCYGSLLEPWVTGVEFAER